MLHTTFPVAIAKCIDMIRIRRASVCMCLCLLVFAWVMYFTFDKSVMIYFADNNHALYGYSFFRVIDTLGEPHWYVISCLLLAYGVRDRNRDLYDKLMFVVVNIAFVGISAFFLKWLLGRARPSLFLSSDLYGFYPDLIRFNYRYMSFPSGHVSVVFAFSFAIYMLMPRLFWWMFAYAFLVSSTRVVLLWHYPSDVFVAIVFAFLMTHVVYSFYVGDAREVS